MVLGIVLIAIVGIFLLTSGTGFAAALTERVKGREQLEREQQDRVTAQQEEEKRAKKGAIGNTLDFLAGEGTTQKLQKKRQIEAAESEIEKQARQAGFSSVEEAERATDSGSIVIGSSKKTVDFGLIGDVIPTDPSPEFLASEEGRRIFGARPRPIRKDRFGGRRGNIFPVTGKILPVLARPPPFPRRRRR